MNKLIFGANPVALAVIAAACYVSATFAMKTFSLNASVAAALVIFGFMATGISVEIIAMGREQLGILYILILGLEVLLVVLVSVFLLGESYTKKDVFGLLFIGAGILALIDRT
ncbi:MAG: hypothetical protein AAFY35_05085 [Pseudomonadota bacterium]